MSLKWLFSKHLYSNYTDSHVGTIFNHSSAAVADRTPALLSVVHGIGLHLDAEDEADSCDIRHLIKWGLTAASGQTQKSHLKDK